MAARLRHRSPSGRLEICSTFAIKDAITAVCASAIHTYKTLTQLSSLYTPPLPSGRFNWLPSLWAIPDTFVLTHQSLDSYLFLRFLKLSVVACLVGCCITWPILFPVNATGGAGQTQLNVLTMSNVDSPWRFFAHAGCAWLYFGEFSLL
jgi:hypothetical protein